jgi:hypothetical protein
VRSRDFGNARAASALAQQFILMPDSTADKIVKFDFQTGAVVDANFILDAASALTYDFNLPKDVFQVDNQIWVIDQNADSVFRFDLNGVWLGTTNGVAGTLDNCRGGEYVNGVVYVTNDGTGNGASGDTVVTFDTNGVRTGAFSVADSGASPFDVVGYNGELLVCHFTSVNRIGRYNYAGNPLTPEFHSSNGTTGIDLPEQFWVTAANTVLVSGFGAPIGVYEYDSSGAQINFFANTAFLRGVCELGNGNLMFSDSGVVKVLDRNTLTTTTVYTSTGCQFFGKLSLSAPPTVYCTAGTSTNGCVPAISASAQPSASLATPCTISVANVEGQKQGLVFYGLDQTGFTPAQWGAGSSFLCVKSPTQRTTPGATGGTLNGCDGALSVDWNAFQLANPTALGNPFAAGAKVYAQGWYRDPPASKTTNLSDAIELTCTP